MQSIHRSAILFSIVFPPFTFCFSSKMLFVESIGVRGTQILQCKNLKKKKTQTNKQAGAFDLLFLSVARAEAGICIFLLAAVAELLLRIPS